MTNDFEYYYGEPEPISAAAAATKFFQIAEPAHDRFSALPAYNSNMQLIPLEPGGKRPVAGFLPSKQVVPKSREALALLAADYADDNVGIRSRRAVGGLFVIDCDKPGVVERIEQETGCKLPLTYTTQTRPQSAPYKMNFHFMSTEHSVLRVRKQVTDVGHIAGYDLKCCGGWGHVRAEGSTCGGETVVALHNVPIVAIPDWLVDWLVADVAKARAQKRAAMAEHAKNKEARQGPPSFHSFVVPHVDRNYFIQSRIRIMKNMGWSDDKILPPLIDDIRNQVENGAQLLLTKGYVSKLRVRISKVPTIGPRAAFNALRHRRASRKPKPARPITIMRERFSACPDTITSTDARAFFSVRTHTEEVRMYSELRAHGYVLTGPQGSHNRVWTRTLAVNIPVFPSSTSTKIQPLCREKKISGSSSTTQQWQLPQHQRA